MKSWLFVGKLLPSHRQNQRGQTLVIFAFLAIFMLLLLGLVLDSARLFILAAQAERVAEAASLAGALYMPDYFDTTSPDGQSAVQRACDIASQNGVTNCRVWAGQIGADVEKVPGNQYEIQVTVTLQADVFFLAYVAPNMSSATVSRTAIAQYLPPIQLGSRSYYFGDEVDLDSNNKPLQNFWASVNGPYDLKEQGDAYTPKWQEGPDDARTTTDNALDIYTIDRWPLSLFTTNHPQYGLYPSYQANADLQPSGFTGANGVRGYNYEIVVPEGNTTPLEVQIYNPAFDPGVANPNTETLGGDYSYDSTYNGKTDQKNEYLQLGYTLYSVPLPFERAKDVELTKAYLPSLDLINSDLRKHNCTVGSQAWDPDGLTSGLNGTPGCVALPSYVTYNNGSYNGAWYPLPITNTTTTYTFTQPGTYRLALEATGYYGWHAYSVKVTDTAGNPPPSGVRMWAWNDMCVHFNNSSTTATFDLGEIPAAYAGKTLTFSIFDPGEANSVGIEILDPGGNQVQFPAWVRTTNHGTRIVASTSGDRHYNGLWLHLPVPIPADYNPAAGSDWWTIKYITGSGVTDTVTVSITLSGSPIHLVSQVIG